MCSLLLGIRMPSTEFQRVKIDDVNFESKIDIFKTVISDKTNIPKDTIELVYCGNILDDNLTLNSCGLKPGVMVHVLKKKIKEVPISPQPMSEYDIRALVIAFRTLSLNPSHRSYLQKLSRPDILENIIMITPGLSQDPVAISLIQDPELIVRLANFDTARRIAELHPALAEAANHIVATVHEEALQNRSAGPSTSAGYNLLDISDDDEMESSQGLDDTFVNLTSDPSSPTEFGLFDYPSDDDDSEVDWFQSSDSVQPSVSRQPSFSTITSAQVAAALASARESGGNSRNTNDTSSGSGITPEMVSEAMQRAMASVAPTAALPSTPNNEPSNSSNLREQMRQMNELGLTDDALNLQALQLSGGNVHAAVDLVFSGAISSDNTM